MIQKYFIPYICVTLPIVGIMTALLFLLIEQTESHTIIVVYILAGLVCIPEVLLWKLLFQRWCKVPYWRMSGHIMIINISLFLTSYCILGGFILSGAHILYGSIWNHGLPFIPTLIPYVFGLAYLYFFARRNETLYLQKRTYQNERQPLKPFLRNYLPPFLWGDLIAVAVTGTFLGLLAHFPIIAKYDSATFILAVIIIFMTLDKIWKQQRIYLLFGHRSYPSGVLLISTIASMATPFFCFQEEYGLAAIAQVVAAGSYLHVYYLYEQEKSHLRNK